MRTIAVAAGVICGILLASGCGDASAKPTAHSTTPPETTAGLSLESPRVQQVALARASNGLFAIFPARPGTRRCAIEGGVHVKPFPGTCTTRIRAASTHEPALIVTFTEKWHFPPCPRGANCRMAVERHTWTIIEGDPIVTAGSHLRIVATRESGATAPQYYK